MNQRADIEKLKTERAEFDAKSRFILRNKWHHIMRRCYDKNNPSYKDYGGRGILVCKRFQKFEGFYNWAIQSGFNPELTIDRIDNNKGYWPSNCRWATKKEQARNTRRNKRVTYNGETKCIAEWAEQIGLSHYGLSMRLSRGLSPDEALSRPRFDRSKTEVAKGVYGLIIHNLPSGAQKEISKLTGLSPSTVSLSLRGKRHDLKVIKYAIEILKRESHRRQKHEDKIRKLLIKEFGENATK